jgi:hypothetical protein
MVSFVEGEPLLIQMPERTEVEVADTRSSTG